MALKFAGNSAVANKDEKLDLGLVDQATSGVVDNPVASSNNTGLLEEARGFVPGSAIEYDPSNTSASGRVGGAREIAPQFDPYEQAGVPMSDQAYNADVAAGEVESLKTTMASTSEDSNYDFKVGDVSKTYLNQENGGIMKRSSMFANAVDKGFFGLNLSNKGALSEFKGRDLAIAMDSMPDKKATVLQAMSRAEGVTQSSEPSPGLKGVIISVPNPVYASVMSAATEHVLMNSFQGTNTEVNPYEEFMTKNKNLLDVNEGSKDIKLKEVTAASNNAQLGQLIHLSYLRLLRDNTKLRLGDAAVNDPTYTRLQLDSPTKLTVDEAEILGAAAKDIWTDNNRDLVDRVTEKTGVGPKTQVKYILTPEGENVLSEGQYARAALFPSQKIKPLRAPGGFETTDIGKNVLRKVAGSDPGQTFGNEVEEAINNLENMGMKVDKQRAKIMLATLLPVLAAKKGTPLGWTANMYNVGSAKLDVFNASANLEQIMIAEGRTAPLREEQLYNPTVEMDGLRNKLAQELRALAEVRNGAFFLTYAQQGFQGRITPQQTYVNPTTSKIVRYVTSAVIPASIKRGNRQDLNLRQLYAKALVKDIEGGSIGDSALPNEKEVLLKQQEGILYARGNRLRQALEMTDAEYEAVSQAMINKIPIDSLEFPKFGGLNLDPVEDADLIFIISAQGEDGAAFIDASIDFANYIDHFKSNTTKPFQSFLNGYMDGKTNGPATQGMQEGNQRIAFQTGVFRKNTVQLLDDGDIRNELMNVSKAKLDGNPFEIPPEKAEYLKAMNIVATGLYANKDLAKIVIMTYGYGKELGGSFDSTFEQLIELMREQNRREAEEMRGNSTDQKAFNNALDVIEANGMKKQSRSLIIKTYEDSVRMLMTNLGKESRALMRSMAAETSIMDTSFQLRLPNDMMAFIGKSVSDGYDDSSPYTMQRGNKYDLKAQQNFENVLTSNSTPEELQKADNRAAREEARTTTPRGTNLVYKWKNRATSSAPRDRNGVLIPGEWAYGGAPVVPIQAVDASVITRTFSGKSFEALEKASYGKPYAHTIYDAVKVDANGYDVVLREINTNWMKINNDWNYLEEALKSLNKAESDFKEMTKGMKESDILAPSQSAFMNWMLTATDPTQGMHLSDKEKEALNKSGGGNPKKVLANFRNRMMKFNPDLESDREAKDFPIINLEDRMKDEMKKVGYDVLNPPSQPTFLQLKVFRRTVRDALQTRARLVSAIDITKREKEQLRKLMRKESGLMYTDPQGYTYPLQYFTH